jgi:hypothetical protein
MQEPKFKFVNRDTEILVDLYKHRFLTISQIHRLHFPSLQTAYRRTRLLKQAGYVHPFSVPNIDESIFSLTAKGIQSVAEALGIDKSELKWNESKTKPHDYYLMQHFIAINDFRISLRQACDNSAIKLLGFIPDYYGEKTDKGGITKYIRDVVCDIANDRQTVSHTPDGVFALERDGKVALFFLEIDRGTEVVSDPLKGVQKMLGFYANYLIEGKYQRYAQEFGVESFKGFRTLILTMSDARMKNMRKAASAVKVSEKAKLFLWLSTYDRLNKASLFDPIWVSAYEADADYHSLWGKNK